MAVNRISQETETRLVGCLEKVASLVEGGLGPTRALVKVARDEDLGPGLVRLMAQAYNNGRTNAQRKAADDLFDKTASFRLADAQAAVKELYPDQVKSAADLHREQAVSDEYGRPPRWARPEVALTKTAVALVGQAPAAYPREGGRHVKKAFSLLREAGKAIEERRRALSATRDKLASSFGELKAYFRRVGTSTPVKQAQVNARLLFGRASDVVFRQLALDDPLIEKAASASGPAPCRADAREAPYRQVGECVELARACCGLQASLDGLRKEAAQAARLVNDRLVVPDKSYHAGSILRPMQKEAILGPLVGAALGNESEDKPGFLSTVAGKAFGGAAAAAGADAFQRALPKGLDSARADAFADLTSPEHEAKLRNVRAQAVLHDILANDEYLAGEHPEKVVKTYNEITKLSPRAADQPMLMRSLLRRYMQQATVEPHDIDQQLGIENKIKDRNKPSEEYNLPPAVGNALQGVKPGVKRE